MRLIMRPITPALILFALLLTAEVASEEPDVSDNIYVLTIESIRQQKYAEADERIQTWMSSQPDDLNLRQAVQRLAQTYSRGPRSMRAVQLFQYLIKKHPDADELARWWLEMGVAYHYAGENGQSVPALERGMSLLVEPQRRVARDLPDDAFEWLGVHYIDNKKWDKAIRVLDKWKPHPGCGTCRESMEAIRFQGILFSLIQSGRHPEAVNRSWQLLEEGNNFSRDTASLVLIRLYQEAGQLADLKMLLPKLAGGTDELNVAIAMLNQKDEIRNLPPRQANAARIQKALALVDDRRFETRIAPFLKPRSEYGSISDQLDSRVAAWLLIRDRGVIERHVWTAMKNAEYDKAALLKVLDLMAIPRHFEGLTYRFFEPWSKPKPGSLPKVLPLVIESTTAR